MSLVTSNWFEVAVRYERQDSSDGGQKMVNELYVVDAVSFAEAEETIAEEMQPYISGEFNIKNITPASYGEIFFSDNENDDKWYKTKLSYITIDEKTAKEKRTSATKLVQASSLNNAVKHIEKVMASSMEDYIIANIAETKIMDVYRHNSIKKEERNDKPEYETEEGKEENK